MNQRAARERSTFTSPTRSLVAALRRRFGDSDPMPAALRAVAVLPPPPRVFPKRYQPEDRAGETAKHTTALLGIGAVGTRYATDVALQFQAELAVATEAVATELPDDWGPSQGLLGLRSRVADHREFLLRPDLGRRLDDRSARLLSEHARCGADGGGPDVQPILADGLSAVACMGSGIALLRAFTTACEARGLSVGTPLCAKFARVWLEDEIGEIVQAKVAAILLGERPGLGTGDGLSAYLVYEPRVGKVDSDRNMMSNIHARGTTPAVAGERLAVLAGAMIAQGRSGVALDLAQLTAELGEAGARAPRAPQVRERLVERTGDRPGHGPGDSEVAR